MPRKGGARWHATHSHGALAIVEKQLSEAVQLLVVPGGCDGAVGRAVEIRRLQKWRP
jgi:hypothetical protein